MIRAILFDLDGTLVDTLDDLVAATNYALKMGGYPAREKNEIKQFIGNGNTKLIERSLPEHARSKAITEKTKQHFFDYYKQHPAEFSKPYDGIVGLLHNLRAEGIYVCIVTNKAQEMTETVVPAVFGDFKFDAIVGQSDGVPAKPQPHMAYIAMNEVGVNADECFFVGDSYTDMLTGGSGGNIPVGVLWGFREKQELLDSGARFIVKHPSEILDLVRQINQC